VAGHHDDRAVRLTAAAAQQADAIGVASDIEQDEVWRLLRACGASLGITTVSTV
jgi:hypothetical protein